MFLKHKNNQRRSPCYELTVLVASKARTPQNLR